MSDNLRNFNFPDATLLSFGEVMAATLPADIGLFKNFDSTITDDYPASIS